MLAAAEVVMERLAVQAGLAAVEPGALVLQQELLELQTLAAAAAAVGLTRVALAVLAALV